MLLNADIVLAPRTVKVRIVLNPVRSLLNSLSLLNLTELRSGLGDWIGETAESMPADLYQQNALAVELSELIEIPDDITEFPAFIDYVAQYDMSDAAEKFGNRIAHKIGGDTAEILSSVENFTAALTAHYAKKGDTCDEASTADLYQHIINHEEGKRLLVSHLTTMWEQYLKTEWKNAETMLQEVVRAFDQLDLSDLTPLEAIQLVTGRDMTGSWSNEDDPDELIFIPNPHMGPYISQWGKDSKNRIHIIYGARIPEGVLNTSTELGLRDLLVQFNALADSTRLRIIALLTQNRELCSQDFQQMLDISQSAASRHLRQLVATGYLDEHRRDLNKYFSLNQRRIHETIAEMRMLLIRK